MHFSHVFLPVFANITRGGDNFERIISWELWWLLSGCLINIKNWHFFSSLTEKISLVEKISKQLKQFVKVKG